MTDSAIKVAGVLFVAVFVFFYLLNIAFKAKQIGRNAPNTQQAAPNSPGSSGVPLNPPNNSPPSNPPRGPFVQPNPAFGPEVTKPAPEATPTEAAFDPSGMVGRWTGKVDGLTEVWTVRCVGGMWEVWGAYFDGAKEVGSFVGSDVRLSGRNLTFVHRFVKMPPRVWGNGSAHSVTLAGGKFTYTWWFGGSSGTRSLTRLE